MNSAGTELINFLLKNFKNENTKGIHWNGKTDRSIKSPTIIYFKK